tara:strand:+ start:3291 stop:4196 length:906 start_codon:yes stop_codon:yes gene_type:complete
MDFALKQRVKDKLETLSKKYVSIEKIEHHYIKLKQRKEHLEEKIKEKLVVFTDMCLKDLIHLYNNNKTDEWGNWLKLRDLETMYVKTKKTKKIELLKLIVEYIAILKLVEHNLELLIIKLFKNIRGTEDRKTLSHMALEDVMDSINLKLQEKELESELIHIPETHESLYKFIESKVDLFGKNNNSVVIKRQTRHLIPINEMFNIIVSVEDLMNKQLKENTSIYMVDNLQDLLETFDDIRNIYNIDYVESSYNDSMDLEKKKELFIEDMKNDFKRIVNHNLENIVEDKSVCRKCITRQVELI